MSDWHFGLHLLQARQDRSTKPHEQNQFPFCVVSWIAVSLEQQLLETKLYRGI
jgi:hypothetical protein